MDKVFLESLHRQQATDAAEAITIYLTAAVAAELQVAPERISADAGWERDDQAFDFIAGLIKRNFGILLYPIERQEFHSLRSLGRHLAQELYGGCHSDSGGDVENVHEGAEWNWPLPGTYRGPQIPRIVLLLSAPRSGSTLLRVMMAGHPSASSH